jgi:hypothetical protein
VNRVLLRNAWRRGAFLFLPALVVLAVGTVCAKTETSPSWRAECVGYHTIRLPGDFEYAVKLPPLDRQWGPNFADGLGVWGATLNLGLGGDADGYSQALISNESTHAGLDTLTSARNADLQRLLDAKLKMASTSDDRPFLQQRLRKEASEIQFYKPLNDGAAFARYDDKLVKLDALIGNRIVSTELKLDGTPQQTVDGFLKRFRPRAPFVIPTEPGLCLPYGFFTAETQPASVGISMRLKDRQDIVIYLHDGKDLGTLTPPKSAKAYLSKAVQNFFYGAVVANPLDGDLKPFRAITIDGREGLGGFGLVTRKKGSGPEAFNNEANKDQDWGYLAYVPADPNAPPGMSSDLVFKVERFGRFAKQPMTEHEFRELAKTIAASIKRRPGAWVPR